MPEYHKLSTGPASLAIWKIEEDEEQLKQYIGGDSFPVLAQFQNEKRRLEWLASRCCLKMLGYNDPIIYARNKRPMLSSGRVELSISHSFPLVTVLVSPSFHVGVDIESLDRNYERIADKFLTLGEYTWVDVKDTRQMAIVWCAKEALYKLPGMQGVNSFVDMTVLPLGKPDAHGRFRMLVRVRGIIYSYSLEYLFLPSHLVTWVASPKHLLQQGAEEHG